MKIGFIGTGTMGQPMVKNLLARGFAVTAYDIARPAVAAAVGLGATAAGSAAEAAKQGQLVITMLPSSSHVEAAYLGPAGVLEGAARGRLCVDMSTIDPAVSRRVAARLREAGVRFIDAPVSGAVPRAVAGTLTIMVGGEAADVEEARPALAAMGSTIIHVGAVGSGEVWARPGESVVRAERRRSRLTAMRSVFFWPALERSVKLSVATSIHSSFSRGSARAGSPAARARSAAAAESLERRIPGPQGAGGQG